MMVLATASNYFFAVDYAVRIVGWHWLFFRFSIFHNLFLEAFADVLSGIL